jgi:hypothetical protein
MGDNVPNVCATGIPAIVLLKKHSAISKRKLGIWGKSRDQPPDHFPHPGKMVPVFLE